MVSAVTHHVQYSGRTQGGVVFSVGVHLWESFIGENEYKSGRWEQVIPSKENHINVWMDEDLKQGTFNFTL